jgi:uncharacterized protein DUF4058
MPLLDHFHAPLHPQRHWEAFHSCWANAIADALNEHLIPPDYFAETETHAGGRVDIDVATFEGQEERSGPSGADATTATLPARTWSPPAPALQMPAVFPSTFRVQVFRSDGGAVLVGAIELASPGNKDRGEKRRAFAAKCANYLYQGVSLVVVDTVTSRQGNLHNELVRLMEREPDYLFGSEESLYAVAYRPVRRAEAELIEIWPSELFLGQALPTPPLFLGGDLRVPTNLEATYTEACRRLRLL